MNGRLPCSLFNREMYTGLCVVLSMYYWLFIPSIINYWNVLNSSSVIQYCWYFILWYLNKQFGVLTSLILVRCLLWEEVNSGNTVNVFNPAAWQNSFMLALKQSNATQLSSLRCLHSSCQHRKHRKCHRAVSFYVVIFSLCTKVKMEIGSVS